MKKEELNNSKVDENIGNEQEMKYPTEEYLISIKNTAISLTKYTMAMEYLIAYKFSTVIVLKKDNENEFEVITEPVMYSDDKLYIINDEHLNINLGDNCNAYGKFMSMGINQRLISDTVHHQVNPNDIPLPIQGNIMQGRIMKPMSLGNM